MCKSLPAEDSTFVPGRGFVDIVQHLFNIASKNGKHGVKPLHPDNGRAQALQASVVRG